MKVLFLSPRQSDPPNTGAKLREYHLARQLSRSAAVDLLAFHAGTPFAPSFCRQVKSFPRPARYTPGKIAAGLFSSQPLSLLNYYSPQMASAVRQAVAETAYDVIVVESVHMASYRHLFPSGPLVVYNWHNIESELLERFALNTSNPAKRLYARLTARRLRALEAELCRSRAAHVVCSERERVAVLADYPEARVAVVRNGVDLEAFAAPAADTPAAAKRDRILFVGAMDYYPNIAAASFFARQHWPALRAAHPGLRFTIVGSNPVQSVRELAQLPGVEVTGTVPQVAPYYHQAAAVVVPLLEGAGTRLKIVEAMAAQVPVVSTPVGAEGIPAVDGEHLLLRSPDADWAAAVGSLLTQPELAQRLVEQGREFAARLYGWEAIGREFAAQLEAWR